MRSLIYLTILLAFFLHSGEGMSEPVLINIIQKPINPDKHVLLLQDIFPSGCCTLVADMLMFGENNNLCEDNNYDTILTNTWDTLLFNQETTFIGYWITRLKYLYEFDPNSLVSKKDIMEFFEKLLNLNGIEERDQIVNDIEAFYEEVDVLKDKPDPLWKILLPVIPNKTIVEYFKEKQDCTFFEWKGKHYRVSYQKFHHFDEAVSEFRTAYYVCSENILQHFAIILSDDNAEVLGYLVECISEWNLNDYSRNAIGWKASMLFQRNMIRQFHNLAILLNNFHQNGYICNQVVVENIIVAQHTKGFLFKLKRFNFFIHRSAYNNTWNKSIAIMDKSTLNFKKNYHPYTSIESKKASSSHDWYQYGYLVNNILIQLEDGPIKRNLINWLGYLIGSLRIPDSKATLEWTFVNDYFQKMHKIKYGKAMQELAYYDHNLKPSDRGILCYLKDGDKERVVNLHKIAPNYYNTYFLASSKYNMKAYFKEKHDNMISNSCLQNSVVPYFNPNVPYYYVTSNKDFLYYIKGSFNFFKATKYYGNEIIMINPNILHKFTVYRHFGTKQDKPNFIPIKEYSKLSFTECIETLSFFI